MNINIVHLFLKLFPLLQKIYDKRKGLHRLTVEQVEAAGFQVYSTKIRDNVALGEAPAAGLDIFRYAPRSNGAADYSALADEIQAHSPIKHVKHTNTKPNKK